MGRVSAFVSNTCDVSDDDESEINTAYMHTRATHEVVEIAGVLRNRCTGYAEEGSYNLCEFLDTSNVENFVNWLLYVR
jgi:hypothetical protein